MATKTKQIMSSKKGRRSRTSASTKFPALKLSERIQPNNSKAKKTSNGATKKGAASGYLMMGGKLVNASDIGVKLRLAGSQPAAAKLSKDARANSNKKEAIKPASTKNNKTELKSQPAKVKNAVKKLSNKKNLNPREAKSTTKKISIRRQTRTIKPKSIRQTITEGNTKVAEVIKKQASKKNKKRDNFKSSTNYNQLVINTDVNTNDKVLIFYNLALGIKQDSLKKIIEKLSDVPIRKIRVNDLATGSSSAHVWLSNPNLPDLEKVRTLFDSALVDGRTIQVLLTSESTRSLAY